MTSIQSFSELSDLNSKFFGIIYRNEPQYSNQISNIQPDCIVKHLINFYAELSNWLESLVPIFIEFFPFETNQMYLLIC